MRVALLWGACGEPPAGVAPDTASVDPDRQGLVESGPVVCADPDTRATEGAFAPWDLGEDWAVQVPPSGLDDTERGAGLVVADLDGDEVLDVFLPNLGTCQLLLGVDGELVDASELLPDGGVGCDAWGASAADVDGDGDVDLFVAVDGAGSRLWRNDVAGFTDISEEAGLLSEVAGARSGSWADLDGDGHLELLVAHHHALAEIPDPSTEPGLPNQLYRSQGGASFAADASALGDAGAQGYSFLVAPLDLDADGDLDLYEVNDFGHSAVPNRVLWNEDGEFVEGDGQTGLELAVEAMGLAQGDLDGDGRPDLVVTDIEAVHLLLSGSGAWADSALSLGLSLGPGQHAAWGAELADLDHDGDLDLPVAFGPLEGRLDLGPEPMALFEQTEDGFVDAAVSWGLDVSLLGRGLLVVDLDGDGWLDLLARDYRTGPARAWRARCGAGHWLTVRLDDDGSQPMGLGARVEVRAGDQTWIRWIDSSHTSLASSGPARAHVGLAEHARVDELLVVWPDGEQSVWTDIAADQHLVASRP